MGNLLSLNADDHIPFATPSLMYDRSLQLEDYQETQNSCEKRELFAGQDALAVDEVMIKKRESYMLMDKDDINNKKKKIRKMPKKIEAGPVVNDDSTELLKRFITGEMFGFNMKLVIQKILYESDMNTTQNRLNMPIKQLKTQPHELLTDDEIRMVDETKDGIEVRVVGPTLQMYEKPLCLKKWHMKHTDNYVLKTNWNNFVAANYEVFKIYTMIQVWAFRKDGQLCFAIVPVERPEAVNEDAA